MIVQRIFVHHPLRIFASNTDKGNRIQYVPIFSTLRSAQLNVTEEESVNQFENLQAFLRVCRPWLTQVLQAGTEYLLLDLDPDLLSGTLLPLAPVLQSDAYRIEVRI